MEPLPASLRLVVFGGICLLPPAIFVLYSFPPGETSFYPQCAFHALTGLHCPGCGATRAAHALLHSDWRQAAAWNLWLVLSLPLLAWVGVRIGAALLSGRCLRSSRLLLLALRCWVICGLVFAVVRNLDVWPLLLLAPHRL